MSAPLSNHRGVTLIELMTVVAIVGLIMWAGYSFFSGSIPFFARTKVRQQLLLDSRICMETIQTRMRNGKARTLVISTPNTTPSAPNSRVDFVLQTTLPSGATAYAIYLDAPSNTVYTQEFTPSPPAATNGAQPPQPLVSNVTGLSFTGDSSDPGIVMVTLQMDAPWDTTGDPTHVSSVLQPNQVVHMVESQ